MVAIVVCLNTYCHARPYKPRKARLKRVTSATKTTGKRTISVIIKLPLAEKEKYEPYPFLPVSVINLGSINNLRKEVLSKTTFD